MLLGVDVLVAGSHENHGFSTADQHFDDDLLENLVGHLLVEAGKGVVQNVNVGVLIKRATQTDALFLSTTQVRAVWARQLLVLVREALNVLDQLTGFQTLSVALLVEVRPEKDVFPDRLVLDPVVLRHHRHAPVYRDQGGGRRIGVGIIGVGIIGVGLLGYFFVLLTVVSQQEALAYHVLLGIVIVVLVISNIIGRLLQKERSSAIIGRIIIVVHFVQDRVEEGRLTAAHLADDERQPPLLDLQVVDHQGEGLRPGYIVVAVAGGGVIIIATQIVGRKLRIAITVFIRS